MENAVIELDEQIEPVQKDTEQSEAQWIIRRPKRKIVTEEEALKWTESFAAERKESFIAAIRKSKG